MGVKLPMWVCHDRSACGKCGMASVGVSRPKRVWHGINDCLLGFALHHLEWNVLTGCGIQWDGHSRCD